MGPKASVSVRVGRGMTISRLDERCRMAGVIPECSSIPLPRPVRPIAGVPPPAVRAAASPGERHVRQPFHTLNRFSSPPAAAAASIRCPPWPTPAFRAWGACRCRCGSSSNPCCNLDGRRITEADVRRPAGSPAPNAPTRSLRGRPHRAAGFHRRAAAGAIWPPCATPWPGASARTRGWSSRGCRSIWWWTTRCRWITTAKATPST